MRILTVFVAVLAASALAQDPAPAPKPADVATPQAIVAALYDSISGPAGQKRDWDRMRSLFAPGARLVPVSQRADGSGAFRPMTVEEYITGNAKAMEEGGFHEKEIFSHSDTFGRIVQVFSTYEARRKADDLQPLMRGINSIQLLGDGKRWWIANVMWQAENPGLKVPKEFDGGGGARD